VFEDNLFCAGIKFNRGSSTTGFCRQTWGEKRETGGRAAQQGPSGESQFATMRPKFLRLEDAGGVMMNKSYLVN